MDTNNCYLVASEYETLEKYSLMKKNLKNQI